MIKVSNLDKTVDSGLEKIEILKQINIEIGRGDSVAILGASGSGKSTLLGLMAGLDTPTSGEVFINGNPFSSLSEDQRAKVRAQQVGFVFQNFYLVPGLNVYENVMLPLEIYSRFADKDAQVHKYIEKVELSHRANHLPAQLSGGEQQRVALARAFVMEPEILFADEPTGNLDQSTGQTIIDLLFDLNQSTDTTLVLVTHDKTLARKCQHQFELDNGHILKGKE